MDARELIVALLFFPMEEEVDVLIGVPDEEGRAPVSIYGRGAHVDVGEFLVPERLPRRKA